MKQDWLTGIYMRIKESRDRELDHILSLLRPKAASDREIAEAVKLLGRWRSEGPSLPADTSLHEPDKP